MTRIPLLSLLPLLALAPARADDSRHSVDRVAATVNGEVVTLSEIIERAGPAYRKVAEMRPGEAKEKARLQVLQAAFDALVSEKLLDVEVKVQGVEVSEAQIDAAIDDIKKRNKFDDAMLKQALAEQGLDLPGFREQLRKNFEGYAVLTQKVRSRVKVTDDDVQNYYQTHPKEFAGEEQVKVRHIFLVVPQGANAEKDAAIKAQGEAVLARLAAGEDFISVARQVSQGPSAAEGGDLGWLHRGSIQLELERVAFSLDVGKWSGLVRTKSGYHILKVEEKRSAEVPPLADVKDRIRDKLGNDQADVYRKQYLDELKRDATIEVLIPELKTATAPDPKAQKTPGS
ncbi:MAG TPA: peptidylprolyl isomerase [Anaeromyxobacteraceae bacterium]|nr:peptidylprolyl isomerase [Anaeromyxobacteraceae bacterium]